MEMIVWNTDEQRLATIEVEFTEENTTWFEGCVKGIDKITDVDGSLLISEIGYNYPVLIGGKSRADIEYGRAKARILERVALNL